ncbi:MAG: Gfo/Idh/MocA family oxidoreductase, partial [Saprospiraceae bacterium]
MPISRRQLLKTLSAATGTALFGGFPQGLDTRVFQPNTEEDPLFLAPDKPVTAITLGAGARGNTYGNYAIEYPGELDIVGVAEPKPLRNQRYTEKHNIAEANRFDTWERVFERPRFADAVLITMPDNLHYGPCMAALKAGYDVLLEKPIAPTEKECRDILAM